MPQLSATEVARRFSEVLDAVEHRGETFTITRNGRVIAQLGAARPVTGARLKQRLREHPPDEAWLRELRELRELLELEERAWPG